mmetsp:Transcript_11965/g.34686  ORF Transcript_11965/g.34686 Transcript_11965/m.34686 type:complete len:249 (-) Transcript_11965:601-1347(-)
MTTAHLVSSAALPSARVSSSMNRGSRGTKAGCRDTNACCICLSLPTFSSDTSEGAGRNTPDDGSAAGLWLSFSWKSSSVSGAGTISNRGLAGRKRYTDWYSQQMYMPCRRISPFSRWPMVNRCIKSPSITSVDGSSPTGRSSSRSDCRCRLASAGPFGSSLGALVGSCWSSGSSIDERVTNAGLLGSSQRMGRSTMDSWLLSAVGLCSRSNEQWSVALVRGSTTSTVTPSSSSISRTTVVRGTPPAST